MDCEIIFDPQEWRAAYIMVKRYPPPRLGEVILLVASLAGYLGRKHDGPPGAKVMWSGLQRLCDFVIALEAQQVVAQRCITMSAGSWEHACAALWRDTERSVDAYPRRGRDTIAWVFRFYPIPRRLA